MNNSAPRHPELIALSFVITPALFFSLIALVPSIFTLASYPFLAWSLAALAAAGLFFADRGIMDHLQTAEKLAILAGHAFLALLMSGLAIAVMPLCNL
jgi:hypothetical protein